MSAASPPHFAPSTTRAASPGSRDAPGPEDVAGRVLVVDDDGNSRSLLADWLSAYGHQVTTASDGYEALRAVERSLPDAIVLDAMMPGMDGFMVCEKLKANPATAVVPVLLLTALHEREDRMRGMRAGANDFLLKPADLPYVLLRVRNAVRLKLLHDEVRTRFQEVCREQQFRDNLLHMIVHDLRTPLAGLEGFLQLLQMSAGPKLEERANHYLNQALRATHNLAHQVDLLLDIHRMEAGRMPVQLISHNVMEVVDKALAPLRPLFGSRQFVVEGPGLALAAVGDPGLLGRVLANLVGNAIAFTSPQEGKIALRIVPEQSRTRLEVVDNGPGIEPAHQETIFNKFHQVGSQVRDRSSGLGLAFCKLAMEAQKGRIGVVSQPGAGSRFWVELPAGAD
jgi:two-component system, sensor histidine kinase and response regulator